MSSWLGTLLLLVGAAFDLVGCIGLVRLPDVYNRLQAGTKCVTLGTCLILLGTAVLVDCPACSVKAILCLLFVLVTSPTAAHALARGAKVSGVPLWEGSVLDQWEGRADAGRDERP
ncbi:MAG TPA: Na+/H+ antiporter subunit G [Lentisphaerae bacterium]|nr:Na+/H+ antiporter subunit G [Lentisphaerota bacterium]